MAKDAISPQSKGRKDNCAHESIHLPSYRILHDNSVDGIGQLELYNYSSRHELYEAAKAGRSVTRVIDLKPGKFDDKLEVALRAIDLDQKPQYEAVSYTWKETSGSREQTEIADNESNSAEINPIDLRYAVYCGEEYFAVNIGLYNALRRLRDESEIRTYWVDQLCIDQANIFERSWQVSMMTLIYNRAKRAIVWVGEEGDDSKTAISMIRTWTQAFDTHLNPLQELRDGGNIPGMPSFDSIAWTSLFKFFNRPVFGRVWII